MGSKKHWLWVLAIVLALVTSVMAGAYTWLFSSTIEGWTPVNMEGYTVSGSYVRLNPGGDPQFISPHINMQPAGANYFKAGVKNKGGDTRGRIYWSGLNPTYGFSEGRSVAITVPNDGQWHNIVARLDDIPNWWSPQTIDQIRFDPVVSGTGGQDSVLIDYVFLRYDSHEPDPPVITSVVPSGWTNGPITINFQSNDPSDYSGVGPDVYGSGVKDFRYRIDPQPDNVTYPTSFNDASGLATGSVTYSPSQLANGVNTFHVYCFDRVGRVSPAQGEHQANLYFDNQDPSVPTPSVSPAVSGGNSFTFQWPASNDYGLSGVQGYYWRVNNGAETFYPAGQRQVNPGAAPNIVAGSNKFEVRAVDNVGNISGYGVVYCTVDAQAPPTPLSANSNPTISKTNSFAFGWSSVDDIGGADGVVYKWWINSGPQSITSALSLSAATYGNIVEGTNYFHVAAGDGVGNWSAPRDVAFIFDTQGPSAPGNVRAVPDESEFNSFAFAWDPSIDASSGVVRYWWVVNGGQPYSTTSTSVGAGPYGLDGSNTVTVWAEDGAGNLSVQSSSTFVYHAPQGPAHITVDKSILEFAAAPEGILPDTQWVTIANSGGGALRLTIHADSSWITVGPYTTWYTNYVRLPLVINTTSMPETTYTASVTIVSGAADNSPFVIPISYVVTRNYLSDGCLEDPQTVASVQQAGQHYLYAGRLKISADKTWSCDGGHNCTARGHVNINGILGFEGDLSVNTSSGRIRGNGAVTVLNRNGSTLATLWQGEIDFTAQDVILKGLIGPDRYSRLKIAGLQVELGEISLLPDGVGIAGKLVFPNLGKTKLSITNIQVTQSSGIRLAGEFSPPPLSIGGLTLKDMRLSFNTITNSFGGSVNVEVPKLVTVGGTVGIVNGSLNTIGLQVNLSQGIPIDATGLSLSGGSGLLDHISDGKGLLISLTVDIKGVYSVAGYDVFKFDDVGVTVEPPSKFSVGGSFRVFNLPVARGSGVYDRGVINTSFKVNLLNGVFDGDFNASLSKGRISGSATGTLKTPSNLPLILKPLQNKKIASASAQFQNANLSGDIQGCLFRRCVKATWKLEYAGNGVIKYCFPCNITTFTQKFMRTAPRDGVYYAFDVEPGSGEIWFSIRSESGIAPGYELIDPSGHSIDSSTAQFIRSDEDSAAVYIVTAPAGGTWQIHVRDYGSAVLTPEAMRFHVQPQITILEPSAPTNSTVIRWMDSDPERSAEINFYYDSDNSNFDGSPITGEPIRSHDSLGSLSWDVSSLPAGDYYIYAVIADSFSAPYAVYAPGIVTIPSSSVPTPPQGFQAVPTDTSIVLGWNRVSDSVIGYVVHYSEDTSSLSLESVIGVDDTDLVEITALKPGRTYKLAISALDSIGNQSQLSNSVIVPFKVVGSNNPPCITSPAPGTRAIAGRPYYAALSAADMDNDVISFVADSVPSGMGVTANSIQWTPDTSQTGPVAVRILASDGNGGTDTLEFTINVIDEASLVGSIGFNRSLYIGKDEQVIVSVVDVDRDMDLGHVDSVMVSVTSTSDVAGFPMWLRETSAHSGQFSGDIGFDVYASNMMQHKIKVQSPDTVFVRYVDTDPAIVVYASGAWENGTCCTGTTGNVNSQGGVDLADLSALVSYLTGGGLSLTCNPEANVNGSGAVDLADLSALVSYLTGGGYVLPSCP